MEKSAECKAIDARERIYSWRKLLANAVYRHEIAKIECDERYTGRLDMTPKDWIYHKKMKLDIEICEINVLELKTQLAIMEADATIRRINL